MSETEKYEKIVDVVLGLADALEAAAVDAKHRVSEIIRVKETAAVKEETFNILKFEPQKSERLGEYEVAHKSSNLPEHWNSAYNVLTIRRESVLRSSRALRHVTQSIRKGGSLP